MNEDFPFDALTRPLPALLAATSDWLDLYEWDEANDAVFQLVRALRSHDATRELSAEAAFEAVMRVESRRPGTLRVPGKQIDSESFEIAFLRAWNRVRFPMGTDALLVACGLAGEGLLRPPRKRTRSYPRFITIAALLQAQTGSRPILLPSRKLAAHFPCEKNSVVAWTAWAIEDRVLIRTKTHMFQPGGERRAAEYVFGLHLCRDAVPTLGQLLGRTLRTEDIDWVEAQFAAAAGAQQT